MKMPVRFSREREHGVTSVSVMLLVVALLTLGLLVVRSSTREMTQAGQLVARERALMVAQAAIDLAAAHYRTMPNSAADAQINNALAGYSGQAGTCTQADKDCIPGANNIVTGQRNSLLENDQPVDCNGRPCMRQGAVVRLPDADDAMTDWCGANNGVPFRDLVPNGDAEARVCVWIRNNLADVLGPSGSGSWTADADGRVVITAMATVRNSTVTVEQELVIDGGAGPGVLNPQSPDEGYGGGHNNDNSAVSVCLDDYVQPQS